MARDIARHNYCSHINYATMLDGTAKLKCHVTDTNKTQRVNFFIGDSSGPTHAKEIQLRAGCVDEAITGLKGKLGDDVGAIRDTIDRLITEYAEFDPASGQVAAI